MLAVACFWAAGRLGGEEFLLVLPECSLEEGVELAERICHVVSSELAKTKNERIEVSISLGVAVAKQLVPADLEALLGSADAALYLAKRAGRIRVEFSADPLSSSRTPTEFNSRGASHV